MRVHEWCGGILDAYGRVADRGNRVRLSALYVAINSLTARKPSLMATSV